MPSKRKESPFYYARRRNLIGYGDTGRISTSTTKKSVAEAMERALVFVAHLALEDPSWRRLLDAICRERKVTLADLLKAKSKGKEALVALKRSLTDPPLREAMRAFGKTTGEDRSLRLGMDILLQYANPKARLGDLSARVITDLCLQAERDGRKRNSVRRTLHRAISRLLRYHLGNAERNRIFADVQFPAEDDTREVYLSPEEIARLLGACYTHGYDELAVVIRVALQTSADRGVLLSGSHTTKQYRGLLVRDLRIYKDNETSGYSGEVYLTPVAC